jgi:hypothetical protein
MSSFKVFSGSKYQQGFGLGRRRSQFSGKGLGGFLSKIMSLLSPLINKSKNIALPLLRSSAKAVGENVVESVAGIAKDLIAGKKLSDSAEINLKRGVDQLSDKLDRFSGSGLKSKRFKKIKFTLVKPKTRKLDIFDKL